MPLSSTSIKRPVAVTMFYVAMALLGIYAFSRIGVDLLPNVNIPHAIVQTNYAGATPDEIEKLVTSPLESQVGTISGVKKITSVSKEGISVLSVDFVWGTDMDYALLSLREKLDNASSIIPREAERPSIVRVDPSATPIMTLVLSYKQDNNKIRYVSNSTGEADIRKLVDLKEAARVIFKRRLEQVDGVAQAVITGGLEREVLVEVSPQKLTEYDLTYADISSALQRSNVNASAGSIMRGLFRYSFRTLGEYENLDDIRETLIKRNKDGSSLFLGDIAVVRESFKEREGLTRFNGSETVGILINKEPESNTVDIAEAVNETVKELAKEYPEYELTVVIDNSKFIVDAIQNVQQEIFYGGILAFLILFFFLGSLRNIMIIGVTIPASFVLTILLMYLFKINFNIISLGGIAVGVGMLLDNSIVVIENITRYKDEGLSDKAASLKGSNEVAMPIIASTLTTIAVFIPLIFVRGIVGELFRDQSYSVAFSLGASIITAITLIPMLASRDKINEPKTIAELEEKYLRIKTPQNKSLIKRLSAYAKFPFILLYKIVIYLFLYLVYILNAAFRKLFEKFFPHVNKHMENVIEKYDKLLLWALEHRGKVILVTLSLVALTAFAAYDIKKEFIPESPNEEFVLELTYQKGTSLEGNAGFTSKIENAILSIKGVKNVVANIGRVNEFDFLNREQVSVENSSLTVKLDSYEDYYRVQEIVREKLRAAKGFSFSFKKTESAYTQIIKPSKDDIIIKIKNNNLDEAFKTGEELIGRVNEKNIEGLAELRIGIEKGDPEYRLTVDRDKCMMYGLSVSDVSNQIVNLVRGNEAARFSDFDKKITINLRPFESDRDGIDKIIASYVTKERLKIPLQDLVSWKQTENYNEIWREGQSRIVYLYGSLAGSDIDKITGEITSVINDMPGNSERNITVSGVNEEISSSLGQLFWALIIAVLLMYMVLASEFESFLFPFIIIFSVPLGLIGSILILYFSGASINIISVLGLIILVGIADNDAVVKVEFIMRKRMEGLPLKEAILTAGKERFRPIVMNTFTVVFGFIPMIIGLGAATQLRVSLSLAVVGGLLSSTFLTLIVIPVLYTFMEKYSRKFQFGSSGINE